MHYMQVSPEVLSLKILNLQSGAECLETGVIRRVKCDEGKPSCQRCLSGPSRKCDGYVTATESIPENDSQGGLLLVRLPEYPDISDDELRAFQFFHEHTLTQLPGFHSCEFWDVIVRQIAREDVAVRHALVALAALHENFAAKGDSSSKRRTPESEHFALKQYNLAIHRHLQQIAGATLDNSDTKTLELERYLVSSLIFICIEIIRGHFASCMSLLKRTFGIFADLTKDIPKGQRPPSGLFEIFERQLNRLEAQSIVLIGYDAWDGQDAISSGSQATVTARRQPVLPALPEAFSSATEARDCFESYMHAFTLATARQGAAAVVNPSDIDLAMSQNKSPSVYLNGFGRWSKALDATMQNAQINDSNASFPNEKEREKERCASLVLHMHRLMVSTSVDLLSIQQHPTDADVQMSWDKYTGVFEQVVKIGESILSPTGSRGPSSVVADPSHSTPPPKAKERPYFTLDIGVVAPLYDIARRCRDPGVRRRAIALLYAYPRQEGMYDGVLAARVAERVVQIEETGLEHLASATDVPDWARISDVHPVFDFERKRALLCYQWRGAHGTVGRPVQEVMDWD
ncbi:hypothetical protein LTR20_000547 [Exophiala xenobiotica]|nr:hypothetical protein LTS13_004933 [Exophiala xenobiotica]KAK5396392.1 hypothetical protein LTR79_006120 [Exophiala xenobiotica]KAK5417071.1 hypothetical protein LTR06_003058 [Exophiala xenobiotica]KAK5424729.1 hypothetical protein LTR90_000319 [Exophiala xenobiotica]KAK5473087.1 hypothetical protein LTR20_000547 [Exophiala xenobiotica]